MNKKMEDSSWNGDMEEWLKDFFLDPLTTFLDEAQFRIDVFETNEQYIIEALFPPCKKEHINVLIEENVLTIMANCLGNCQMEKKQRSVSFPFAIDKKEIQTKLTEDILEISISKHLSTSACPKKIIVK